MLRPACARSGTDPASFVYVDDAGAHLSVAGLQMLLPSSAVGATACLDRIFAVGDGFVVIGDNGVVYDAFSVDSNTSLP